MYPEPAPMTMVKRTLHVAVPIEKAFQVFVGKMGQWWPASHHIGSEAFSEVVVEPKVGGRWFERDAKGTECQWGRVLLYEPPRGLILSWHLQPDWKLDLDPAKGSEVTLLFVAEGPSTTRLEFEHRYIERHGSEYEKLFAGVDSPEGWTAVLGSYQELANK